MNRSSLLPTTPSRRFLSTSTQRAIRSAHATTMLFQSTSIMAHQGTTPKRQYGDEDHKEQEQEQEQPCLFNIALWCRYSLQSIQSFESPSATKYLPTSSPPAMLPFREEEERTPIKNNTSRPNKRRRRQDPHSSSSSFKKSHHGESGILGNLDCFFPVLEGDDTNVVANGRSWHPPSPQVMLQPRRNKFKQHQGLIGGRQHEEQQEKDISRKMLCLFVKWVFLKGEGVCDPLAKTPHQPTNVPYVIVFLICN